VGAEKRRGGDGEKRRLGERVMERKGENFASSILKCKIEPFIKALSLP